MPSNQFSVTVDAGICMGAGYCFGAYPDLFTQSDDGTAKFDVAAQDDSLDKIKKASQFCPSGAIEVHYRKDPS